MYVVLSFYNLKNREVNKMKNFKNLTLIALVLVMLGLSISVEAQRRRRTRRTYRHRPVATNQQNRTPTSSNDFIVPDSTTLVGVLNNNLSADQSRDRQRFTMTVREPSEYEGATVEGYVSGIKRSGKLTGRSEMTLNFDRIRLRDGSSHAFAGVLSSLRTTGGQEVRVDNEGNVERSNSQTRKTEERAAIGTGAGAIIGAIAGGGKGAAIGAILGAGGGAGSVYAQGREKLELTNGTQLTVRASAPRRYNR